MPSELCRDLFTRLVSTNSLTDIAFVLSIEYDLRWGQTINWPPNSLSISLTKSSLCRAHQWKSVRQIEIAPTLNWIYSFLLGVFGKLFNELPQSFLFSFTFWFVNVKVSLQLVYIARLFLVNLCVMYSHLFIGCIVLCAVI